MIPQLHFDFLFKSYLPMKRAGILYSLQLRAKQENRKNGWLRAPSLLSIELIYETVVRALMTVFLNYFLNRITESFDELFFPT